MKIKMFFYFLLLGLILGISQSFIFLLPVTISIFFYFIREIYKMKSHSQGFFYGWIFGVGFFIGSMHWMVNPFLVYEKHFVLIPIGAIIFPILMGFFFSIPVNLIIFFKQYFHFFEDKIFLKSLIISLFFLFSEILRSNIFGGLPLNLIGHVWAYNSEFIQGVKIFGIFGLSFLTILWLVLISNLILKSHIKTSLFLVILFSLILFSFSLTNQSYKKNDTDFLLRVVQPNISQNEKWNRTFFEKNIEKLINLTLEENDVTEQKIVVWPEVALTLYLNEELDFIDYLKKKIPPNIILVVGGLRRILQNGKVKIFNSLYILEKNKFHFYDKKKLVPFGEFIPFRSLVKILKLTPGSTDFSVGKNPSVLEIKLKDKDILVEPSICYEAIFQTLKAPDSHLMINITNDAWFGNNFGPKQHLSAQIFRAVEKSSPLVRSANSGISVITDKNGKIIKKINLNEMGFVELKLPLEKKKTFFERYNNYSVLALIFLVFFLFYLIDIFYQLKVKVKSKI